jgi:hypothetical protein
MFRRMASLQENLKSILLFNDLEQVAAIVKGQRLDLRYTF